MLVENKLTAWIQAGLALYKANPLMIEPIFYDMSQSGRAPFMAPGLVVDTEKRWIPHEYDGGVYRWGGASFPIVENTRDTLTLIGDPSTVQPIEPFAYQIVPPGVAGLTELLTTESFTVMSSFAQVPTHMPCFTIRLERDQQSDAYLGEHLEHYATNGVEFDIRTQALTGSYLISIWATNRESTLWLYAWLHNYALQSMTMFTTWGLYDVALSGSDLDPSLTYLPERTYVRHFLLTASRMERAVETTEVEWVSAFCLELFLAYARFDLTLPASA